MEGKITYKDLIEFGEIKWPLFHTIMLCIRGEETKLEIGEIKNDNKINL